MRTGKTEEPKLFIAVVHTNASKRWEGDLACWVGAKPEIIKRALQAKEKWERNGHGPYRVLVGSLTEEAKELQRFSVERLRA